LSVDGLEAIALVLALTFNSRSKHPINILAIGAHCDDIEIGCGGTLMTLQQRSRGCRVHWLVLTSGAARRKEAERSVNAFVRTSARGETRICDLPDGLLPAHFAEVKAEFQRIRKTVAPDLVLTHHGADLHQDHRLLSEITWQTFRDHTIWEYEIPKYDGDLRTPNLYVPLASAVAKRKASLIMKLFASQLGKAWFKAGTLEALMRLRGVESHATSGYAEAFHCRKLVFEATAPTSRGR
jgi:LmbE family N-acetylglucosaminyl deacetylase